MGKMKDISIELEEAGLDPLDNSNLNRYVDDTHHFGEDVLKGGFVTINEQYGAYGTESVKLELHSAYGKHELNAKFNETFQKFIDERYEQKVSSKLVFVDGDQLSHFGIDRRHMIVNGRQMGKSFMRQQLGRALRNGTLEKFKAMSGPFHVDGNKHSSIHINLTAPEGLWFGKRYSYSGRLAKGRLHYDVIDHHTREVVTTYRQIKKAKARVKELNRG